MKNFPPVIFSPYFLNFFLSYRITFTSSIRFPSAKRNKPSPLSDAYLQYLVPREDMADRLPDGVPYEDVGCVLHRVRKLRRIKTVTYSYFNYH